MELAPNSSYSCRMCGGNHSTVLFCNVKHPPGRQRAGQPMEFLDATTVGDGLVPHLHRTCRTCGYEWLTEVKP